MQTLLNTFGNSWCSPLREASFDILCVRLAELAETSGSHREPNERSVPLAPFNPAAHFSGPPFICRGICWNLLALTLLNLQRMVSEQQSFLGSPFVQAD